MSTSEDVADARPVPLVLGASGDLGSALCRRLATRGDRLVPVLLLDPTCDWITGQVWGVDGGLVRARAQG